jgi:hypothetical protein
MIAASELSQATEFVLHLAKHETWKRLQSADKSAIVDGTALVDHHLAILAIAGHTPRE